MTDTLNAPYNFVPLSGHVFTPGWADQVHQDLPLANGLSGRVRYRIRAHGPIIVGGEHVEASREQLGRVSFFRLPDGAFAIPGTSVRGMIRNVLEIAAFGKMQLVDDRRYSLRDLTGPVRDDYGDRMAKRVVRGDRSTFAARSQAGWLRFDPGEARWKLRPCAYGRITHDRIAELSGQPAREFGKPRTSAMDKYHVWQRGKRRDSLEIEVVVGEPQGRNQLAFVECHLPEERPGQPSCKGALVFTGQPNSKKRREFVLFDEQCEEVDVPPEVMAGFLDVHDGPVESAEWKYWRRLHDQGGDRIPVFYLLQVEDQPLEGGGQIEALGLAMMFKLASTHSTHALRANAPGGDGDPHGDVDRFDLAQLVLGRIHDRQGQSLRGRASFGVARLSDAATARTHHYGPSVLGEPKASYFPTYLRQPRDPASLGHLPAGESYRTWMTAGAELAGWKRYPVHAAGERPDLPPLKSTNEGNRKVQVELEALDGGGQALVFEGWLRFHNLLPEELGALVWCVEWGGRTEHRHAIGLARFAGFGAISMMLDRDRYEVLPNDPEADAPKLEDCVEAFRKVMEGWARAPERQAGFPRGWEQSLQVEALLAMADPTQAAHWPGRLEHMVLDPRSRPKPRNDFVAAKNQRLVLAPYGDPARESERPPVAAKTQRRPAESRQGAPRPQGGQAPQPAPNSLLPAGTPVEFAGAPGRLHEPLRRGMTMIDVDFGGDVEPVPVTALDLPESRS